MIPNEQMLKNAYYYGYNGVLAGKASEMLIMAYGGMLKPADFEEGAPMHVAYLNGRADYLDEESRASMAGVAGY